MLPLPAGPRVHAACFGAMDGLLVRPFTVLCPPLSAPRLNAACFGAMGVGVLGGAFLCYPHIPRSNAACFGAMGADEPLVCSPPSTAARVSAAHFGPFYCGWSGVTGIPYAQPERCPRVAVLVEGALLQLLFRTPLTSCILSGRHSFSYRGR